MRDFADGGAPIGQKPILCLHRVLILDGAPCDLEQVVIHLIHEAGSLAVNRTMPKRPTNRCW
jgi:hypothetical protein